MIVSGFVLKPATGRVAPYIDDSLRCACLCFGSGVVWHHQSGAFQMISVSVLLRDILVVQCAGGSHEDELRACSVLL